MLDAEVWVQVAVEHGAVWRTVVGAHETAAIANHASSSSDSVDAAPIARSARTSAIRLARPRSARRGCRAPLPCDSGVGRCGVDAGVDAQFPGGGASLADRTVHSPSLDGADASRRAELSE